MAMKTHILWYFACKLSVFPRTFIPTFKSMTVSIMEMNSYCFIFIFASPLNSNLTPSKIVCNFSMSLAFYLNNCPFYQFSFFVLPQLFWRPPYLCPSFADASNKFFFLWLFLFPFVVQIFFLVFDFQKLCPIRFSLLLLVLPWPSCCQTSSLTS